MMKILEIRPEDTGGHCVVHYAKIQNGGKLVSIGFNEDCFCGYKVMEGEEVAFWCVDINTVNLSLVQNELSQRLPQDIAEQIFLAYVIEIGYEYIRNNIIEDDETGILFESESGQCIYEPFYDETLRFDVDPIEHYGLENIILAIETISKREGE
ncbi:hypothetical protein M2277_005075 [Paenibacillus sp. LBL]|uniref:hypothetical protein n=1 Tax=Paenibacillus sp. LBL TaxID=2940563 RepID=UPI00247655E8|nr:hypothetical protein [Paenibacillus sp. LBL]MDH6674383.1 hypothetical protein [Paenibacillus sp. LBL]